MNVNTWRRRRICPCHSPERSLHSNNYMYFRECKSVQLHNKQPMVCEAQLAGTIFGEKY